MFSAGAFTLPALPIALVCAPPPGAQNKNFAEYSNTTTISSKISTSVTSSTAHKTATAYTTSDFLGKISGTVSGIKGLISAFEGKDWAGAQALEEFSSSVTLGLNVAGIAVGAAVST